MQARLPMRPRRIWRAQPGRRAQGMILARTSASSPGPRTMSGSVDDAGRRLLPTAGCLMGIRTSRWRIRFLVFALWTFLGVFFAVQTYLIAYSAVRAKPDLPPSAAIAWWETLRLSLAEAYLWALFALLIFWLAKRFPFERGRWKRNLPIHLLASLAVAIAESALSALLSEWLRKSFPKPSLSLAVMQLFFVAKLHQNMLFYWAVLGVSQ